MKNFAGLAHRKRGKSASASPTPHHTLNEERSARFVSVVVIEFSPSMTVVIRVRTTFMLRWIIVFLILRFMSCLEMFHGRIRRKMRDLNREVWNFIITRRATFTILLSGNQREKRRG